MGYSSSSMCSTSGGMQKVTEPVGVHCSKVLSSSPLETGQIAPLTRSRLDGKGDSSRGKFSSLFECLKCLHIKLGAVVSHDLFRSLVSTKPFSQATQCSWNIVMEHYSYYPYIPPAILRLGQLQLETWLPGTDL